MTPEDHLSHLARDAAALIAATRSGDGSEPVPGCPDWTLDDLVRHVGGVHRWVREALLDGGVPPERHHVAMEDVAPVGHTALVEWYAGTLADLLDAFADVSPEDEVWTFMPGVDPRAGRAFWARRQAHEVLVHRLDAEGATGTPTPIDPMLALDGVHEVLWILAVAMTPLVRPTPATFGVQSFEGPGWTLEVGPDTRVLREGGDGDVQVTGRAADLLRHLWNRPTERPVQVEGDAALWQTWVELARIT